MGPSWIHSTATSVLEWFTAIKYIQSNISPQGKSVAMNKKPSHIPQTSISLVLALLKASSSSPQKIHEFNASLASMIFEKASPVIPNSHMPPIPINARLAKAAIIFTERLDMHNHKTI